MEHIPFIGTVYQIDRSMGRFVVGSLIVGILATMTPDLLVPGAVIYRIAGWAIITLIAAILIIAEVSGRSEKEQILIVVTLIAAACLAIIVFDVPRIEFPFRRFFAWMILILGAGAFTFMHVLLKRDNFVHAWLATVAVMAAIGTTSLFWELPF